MHINLEITDKHTIQAYSDNQVKINFDTYQKNLIVSKDTIVTDWAIDSIQRLTGALLALVMASKPEIIIVGHTQSGQFAPMETLQRLSEQRIGLECMSIGAACRTYNVLLSEGRNVVLGLIF